MYVCIQVLKECSPGGIFGEDLDGHPVFYYAMGNLDFRGMYVMYVHG